MDLHEAERLVCECEHCVVVLAVSHFEPVHLDHLAPVELLAAEPPPGSAKRRAHAAGSSRTTSAAGLSSRRPR